MNITLEPKRIAVAVALSALVLAAFFGGPVLSDDGGDRLSASENISAERSLTADGDDDDAADGSSFGQIVAAYVGPAEIVFDERDLLVGDEARSAGADASDYYIRDAGYPTTVLPVSDAVTVTRVECDDQGCVEGRPQSYEEFTTSFTERAERSGERYFRILVENGSVVRIDQRYFA